MTEKIDLYSMTEEELVAFFSEIGEKKFRAKQVFSWLSLGTPISEMTNISKELRQRLIDITLDTLPRVEEKYVSKIDGTVKYLFRLYDGSFIESVFMRYKHGNTLCISSQVGCRMGCKFCASTIGGKVRDLLPSEMIGQVIAASRDSGERISNIVMMGIGEPLDNFDNVIKFLRLVNHEGGLNIGYRHISLSTSGIVPKIYELAKVDLPITLSISLHASNDEKRSEIMPINNKWKIAELMKACVDYYKITGRRISFEYTLISGKNDSVSDADELALLIKNAFLGTGAPLHVNLIRVNEVKETSFKAGSTEGANEFARRLESHGIVATVRRRLGRDVNAACGQLRRTKEEKNTKENTKTSEEKA
jgi:23S rRNA (adenine2503-C2)-methyltransferase